MGNKPNKEKKMDMVAEVVEEEGVTTELSTIGEPRQVINFSPLTKRLIESKDARDKRQVMEEYNVMSDALEERRYIAALLEVNGSIVEASRKLWGAGRCKDTETAFTKGMAIIRRPHVKKELERIVNALSVNPRNLIARIEVEAATAEKSSDRLRALELLSKVCNLFKEDGEAKAPKTYNLNISEDAAVRLLKRREQYNIGAGGHFVEAGGDQSNDSDGEKDTD